MPKPSLRDEYIFIRKYWGSFWALYAYLLRIFTFKNPFKESSAFIATRKIKKINAYEEPLQREDYNSFSSALVAEAPLVSVIIPTLNRYRYLEDALHDLEKQTYKNFEVIIFDQSDDFNENFYRQFALRIKVQHQKEKLLWTARNHAIQLSNADYLLFLMMIRG